MRTPKTTLFMAGWLVVLLAASCTAGVTNQPVQRLPSVAPTAAPGDGVPPVDVGRQTLFFRGNTEPMDFRPGSRDLVRAVAGLGLDGKGLEVTAIKTTVDASGVFLVEDAPDQPWGTLIDPARQAAIQAFDANRDLGQFLILVTDVVVHRLQDPVSPTAYRWARGDVDSYAKCGLPADPADPCRQDFYRAAMQVILLPPGGIHPGQ